MRAKFGRGPTFVSKKGSLKFISRCYGGGDIRFRIYRRYKGEQYYVISVMRGWGAGKFLEKTWQMRLRNTEWQRLPLYSSEMPEHSLASWHHS